MKLERVALVGVALAAAAVGVGFYSGVLTAPAGALFGSAAGIDVPPLDDPAMIRRGAAHYDRFCARCHASPARREQAAPVDLSPSPPKLHERVEDWPPEMLFDVVKRGVPGTGMPAWPSKNRDDEVWAMVAFLKKLPNLFADQYTELASLPVPADLAAPVSGCARCHGADGRGSPDGAFPRLDIQAPEYLYKTLVAFQEGRRQSGFMQDAVAGLSKGELREVARHYGRGMVAPTDESPPLAANGSGPACTACHGPPMPARTEYPSLSGQYRAYLTSQFKLLSDPETSRGGGPHVHVMHRVARLTLQTAAARWLRWYALD
jgi:cytochrome c553